MTQKAKNGKQRYEGLDNPFFKSVSSVKAEGLGAW